MKIKIFSILLLLIMLMYNKGVAQNDVKNEEASTWSMGFNVGTSTGIGIALKKEIKTHWAIQTTIMPPIFSGSRIAFASGGLTGFYKIRDNKNFTGFAYLGLAANYSYFFNVDYPILYSVGTGLGVSAKTWNVIAISFMLGYGIYSINVADEEDSYSSFFNLGAVTAEFSLMFYIK